MDDLPLFKVIILGDSGVGKSCLASRVTDGKYNPRMKATIGTEFSTKVLECGGGRVVLQMWDTAGQERHRSLGKAYWRGAAGCVIVFDVTSIDSFTSIDGWLKEFVAHVGAEKPVVIIGNKLDDKDNTRVADKAIRDWSRHNDIPYFLVSAKTNLHTADPFLCLANKISSLPNPHKLSETRSINVSIVDDQDRHRLCTC
eukprot:TRINITY_DN5482_c0_g1_i1.p1 TRINITY_DN5482_c0_g1~~TRINITY_DN5482_c0_g1_i1.p1  ORF type:complete len:199 (+),score=59.62 TRINITY_DN5482_c0_g1_i1:955-1551(+)